MKLTAARGKLIVVTGPPCAGKTTLAERLGEETGAPLFTKDGIKVALFDTLGWGSRDWSRKLDSAVYAILFRIVGAELKAGRTLLVESNFRPASHTAALSELLARHRAAVFQVVCRCDPQTIVQRLRRRAEYKERHAGHRDELLLGELPAILEPGRYGPMDLGGEQVAIDTSAPENVDRAALAARVKAFLDAP